MTIRMECQTLPVGELLSGSRIYSMPIFQRPFAWTADEAGQLLDDLQTAFHNSTDLNTDKAYYFLGQLIVSQSNPNAPFEVVDGQQRLVTLSALLAVLRDLLPPGDAREHLQHHIERPENAARHLPRCPRVGLREIDRDEYTRWIAEQGGSFALPDAGDTDATERLVEVISRIKDDIATPHQKFITDFASYILNHCYAVLVIVSNTLDAYQLFRSINARGQPLTDIDIVRGEVISIYQSTRLADAWSQIEDQIGVEQLSTYVKSILALVHPPTQQMAFRDGLNSVLSHPSKALLFTDTLKKFVEIYDELESCELTVAEGNEELNRIVSCVKALPFDDWTPAALLWLAQNPSEKATVDFFKALDALGLGLLILGATSNTIANRMRRVVQRIVAKDCLSSANSELYLTDAERKKIREKLARPIGNKSRFIRPLLLRLNAELLDKTIPTYFPTKVTLEHILPQNPGPRSLWRQKFPDSKERQQFSQMLGNFAILSTKVNPRASNFDFHKKREKIFGASDSNIFPLTAQLISYEDWTPDAIKKRHDQLTEIARDILKL
ncbi:DUF262 domain-containing HNH endonuclease family protein [Filomicrobium sp.]|uniref:DUF262 domain-containing protein n=1 Tax=Filomicrobium sp. TaxID=2024831 RepID=UPI002584647A|nr:DUF262 domain-containing HNH endonuclease family protein [Filomicrobium sp.]MCV0370228.1 DUF262 domain-containing HNH endonuclease family protein [Filomicrobium sp.]